MFAHRGGNDGPVALEIAQSLGLDRANLETTADSDIIASVLKRQVKLAAIRVLRNAVLHAEWGRHFGLSRTAEHKSNDRCRADLRQACLLR